VNSARRNPKATFGLAAILMTISGLISTALVLVERSSPNSTIYLSPGQTVTSTDVSNFLSVFIPVSAATLLVTFLIQNILTGLLTAVIGRGVLGREVTISEAWRNGRLGSVIGAAFLIVGITIATLVPVVVLTIVFAVAHLAPAAVLVGVLGGIATIVAEFLLFVRLTLTIPAVVLEAVGPWTGVKRSWQLTSGSYWRLFGILLLTGLIVGIAALVLQIPFAIGQSALGGSGGIFTTPGATPAIAGVVLGAIGSILAGTVTRPISAGVSVLLYLDMRMRKEGLDLVLRNAAQNQGATGDELATVWRPQAPGQQGVAPSQW